MCMTHILSNIYIVLNPKVAQLVYTNVSLPGCYATDTGSGVLWLCHSGEIWKRTSHQHTPQSLSTCHWWNCCWHWLEYKDWFCRKDGCNYCRANNSSIYKVIGYSVYCLNSYVCCNVLWYIVQQRIIVQQGIIFFSLSFLYSSLCSSLSTFLSSNMTKMFHNILLYHRNVP